MPIRDSSQHGSMYLDNATAARIFDRARAELRKLWQPDSPAFERVMF